MSCWTSGSIQECPHCGGFLQHAYTPTDAPATIAGMRGVDVEVAVDDILQGFNNLLSGSE